MRDLRENQSLGQLFGELSQETSALIRQEVQLARAEMTQKATRAGKDVTFLAIGGFVAYAGFLALVAAAIMGLALLTPGWLAALIVGVIVAGVGYLMLQKGMSDLKKMPVAPTRTVQTLKEDKEWLKQQAS